ncbi:carbohydrate ABC transporter permease [Cohnella terricola]|uniref:Carbohydrate ABC transporter permease n=1 Tax=Cohnella terricola TaxID=1289167 RepID=A0A559JWA6_9BACL|nr:carbohydrate ABC transporter permease [Cohnella terricola]TVY04175.1 carbohydrate ABC transporter permease [Cohnella terricola]
MSIRKNRSNGERVFVFGVYSIVILFSLCCLIPFWYVFIDSFATDSSFGVHGYQLWPSEFSLDAYRYLLRGDQIFRSYLITIIVAAVGTALAVLITSTFAYVLANKKMKYRRILSFLTYFTMIFGSGLVGFYILIANWLDLKDSIWSLILPYLLNPFYAFILVSFYKTLPAEINESATIDGAREFRIFFSIIFPITVPAIATITLFYVLQYWNDWWLSLLFIDNSKLHPLQMMIRQLISNLNVSSYVSGSNTAYNVSVPTSIIQMATVCLTIGPIIFAYPFVQRYFVNGLTVGAVKG